METSAEIDSDNSDVEIVEEKIVRPFYQNPFLRTNKTLQHTVDQKKNDLLSNSQLVLGLQNNPRGYQNVNEKNSSELHYKKVKNYKKQSTKCAINVDSGSKISGNLLGKGLSQISRVLSVESNENKNFKKHPVSQPRSVSGVLKNKNPEKDVSEPPPPLSVVLIEKIERNKPFSNKNQSFLNAPNTSRFDKHKNVELSMNPTNSIPQNQLKNDQLPIPLINSDSENQLSNTDTNERIPDSPSSSVKRLLQNKAITVISESSGRNIINTAAATSIASSHQKLNGVSCNNINSAPNPYIAQTFVKSIKNTENDKADIACKFNTIEETIENVVKNYSFSLDPEKVPIINGGLAMAAQLQTASTNLCGNGRSKSGVKRAIGASSKNKQETKPSKCPKKKLNKSTTDGCSKSRVKRAAVVSSTVKQEAGPSNCPKKDDIKSTAKACDKQKSSSMLTKSKLAKNDELKNVVNVFYSVDDDDDVFIQIQMPKRKVSLKTKTKASFKPQARKVVPPASDNHEKSVAPLLEATTINGHNFLTKSGQSNLGANTDSTSEQQSLSSSLIPGYSHNLNVQQTLNECDGLVRSNTKQFTSQPSQHQNCTSSVTTSVSNNFTNCNISSNSASSSGKNVSSPPKKIQKLTPQKTKLVSVNYARTPVKSNSCVDDIQLIKYSPAITASPGKYFGSPKSKSASGGSPTKKHLSKFSPFRKANRNKSPQLSPQKSINQYFAKLPPKINLFNVNVEGDNAQTDVIPGINILDDELSAEQSTGCVKKSKSNQLSPVSETIESASSKVESSENNSQPMLDTQEVNDILNHLPNEVKSALLDQPVVSTNKRKESNTNQGDGSLGGSDSSFYYYDALNKSVLNAMEFVKRSNQEYLFDQCERKILKRFFEDVPLSARYLYCRLFARKYDWIRKTTIKYPGISNNIDDELSALYKEGFVKLDISNENLQFILCLLHIHELKHLCKTLNIPCGSKKAEMIKSIEDRKSQRILTSGCVFEDSSAMTRKHAVNILGVCVKLNEESRNIFLKCLRIFIYSSYYGGNEKLYQEVLDRSSSKHRFPEYEFRPTKVFHSLNNYREYEVAVQLQADIFAALEAKNASLVYKYLIVAKEKFTNIINDKQNMEVVSRMPDFMRRFTAGSTYSSCISLCLVRAFTKNNKKDAVEFYECLLAQNVFLVSKRGKWYVELIKILFNYVKDYNKVGDYFLRAQNDNLNIVAQNALYDQADLIRNRKNVPAHLKNLLKDFNCEHVTTLSNSVFQPVTVLARAMESYKPGTKRVYRIQYDDHMECMSVEEIGLRHFKCQLGYSKGFHDEGKCLLEILLACFWDVIYCTPEYESDDISVFCSWFQEVPADWKSPSFYERRKKHIEERLKEMTKGGSNFIKKLIETCCNNFEGTRSVLSWRFVTKDKLLNVKELVECLPVKFVVNTAGSLLKDFKSFSTGWPDLTLWDPIGKKSIFVEVKGPNDVLSNIQKIRLDNIKKFGGDATICFVQDTSSGHTKRTLPDGPGAKRKKLSLLDDSQDF